MREGHGIGLNRRGQEIYAEALTQPDDTALRQTSSPSSGADRPKNPTNEPIARRGTGLLTRGFGETAPARNRTITERETRATWPMAHGFSTGQSRPPSLTRRPRPARSPPEQQHRSDNPSAAMKLSPTKRGPRAGRLRESGATKRKKKSPGYGRTKPSGRSPPSPGSHPSPSRRSPNFVPSHTRNANAQNYGVRFCFLPFPPSGPPPGGGPRRMKLASGVPRQSRDTNG